MYIENFNLKILSKLFCIKRVIQFLFEKTAVWILNVPINLENNFKISIFT